MKRNSMNQGALARHRSDVRDLLGLRDDMQHSSYCSTVSGPPRAAPSIGEDHRRRDEQPHLQVRAAESALRRVDIVCQLRQAPQDHHGWPFPYLSSIIVPKKHLSAAFPAADLTASSSQIFIHCTFLRVYVCLLDLHSFTNSSTRAHPARVFASAERAATGSGLVGPTS